MHDLGRHRRAVDHFRRRAALAGPHGRSAGAGSAKGLSFLQISDSHVGFDKPANPNALGTLEEAIAKVNALPQEAVVHDPYRRHQPSVAGIAVRRRRPYHLADPARRALRARRARLPRSGAEILSRALRRRHQRRRLVQLRRRRRALHRPRQRRRSQGRRPRQSRQRPARMARRGPQGALGLDPDRRLRPYPAVDHLSGLGLGHRRQRPGALLPQAVRLGDRAQRPYPPGDAEGGRQRHLPHRALDRVSAAGAGRSALRPDR